MKELHIDIETFCGVDLTKVGVYRYAQDPSFKILLFAYSFDDEDPILVDTYYDEYPGESVPLEVWEALTDPNVLKIAQNANFELTCIGEYYGLDLDPAQWYCTMIGAAYHGLPLHLDKIAQVLGLENQKDAKGKALIKYFSMPCKPTKTNGGRTINEPIHDPERWQLFGEYCQQDVRTEADIFNYLRKFPPLPATEWLYWQQDQAINKRGIFIDRDFIEAAIEANTKFLQDVHDELVELTGVDNPNSLAQLKAWVEGEIGEAVPSLAKNELADLLASEFMPDHVRRVLELRQLGSKTSVSKYDTMLMYACDDERIRGLIQFYGANRTGRYAGRAVQIQNLKRTIGRGLDTAKEAVRKGLAELLYDDVADLVSKLVRTALIAPKGRKLISCDFSAIEARVLAWLAGEDWVLEVFRTHGKLYEATASKMFSIPMDEITKGSPWRSRGKVAALALGYQGASGALVQMGALREGLTEEELPEIVAGWRRANPAIVKFWRDVENAARKCITERKTVVLRTKYTALKFEYDRGYMFLTLPSGRRLAYYGAQVNGRKITYYGIDQTRKIWTKDDTYGGSLVENITQAVARDCLTETMALMFDDVNIIFHVHDEIVAEEDDEIADDVLRYMTEVMAISPAWGKGLPLSGEGYISQYYKKD